MIPVAEMEDYKIFNLGNFSLQNGGRIPDAYLAYKTYGTLSDAKDNVIVYPTWYSGHHTDNEWLIGAGKALDPLKYFIVVPNMFGNGLSSSPSNTPSPYNGPRFPNVTLYDNVRAQKQLLETVFTITHVVLAVGWSMGAQLAYQWASQYPESVHRVAPFCGSARTSVHNYVFLEGLKHVLMLDPAFKDGWYDGPGPHLGIRAFARVYAGWGFSQAFYREELHLTLGFNSLEDWFVGFWEKYFLTRYGRPWRSVGYANNDANNLLAMLWTWQNGDISKTPQYKGDFKAALQAIRARAVVMPGQTDLYFPPEDNEIERMDQVGHMRMATCVPIPSIWGHWAGGPGTNPKDVAFIDAELKKLLALPPAL